MFNWIKRGPECSVVRFLMIILTINFSRVILGLRIDIGPIEVPPQQDSSCSCRTRTVETCFDSTKACLRGHRTRETFTDSDI